MATMRVADQKKNLMIHYKGFINLFLNGTMPYTNDCFPPVPPSLASCDRVTAFNILMQSTSRSTSVFTEDALFGKVKGNVKRILKFITEWCRACPSETARNPGVFVPAEPPSGHDRDWVFDKILRAEWRVKQCLRVYKLRVSKSALAENTPAAIRGALLSLNFARRSITLEEERNYLLQDVPDDPEHVYHQVVANTNAGFIADSSSDDENPADTQGSSRPRSSSSIVTTQPAYHEIPFPSPHYDELEFAFKYFTQYAGHGHADISHFYSEEWLSRSSHASGAFGRRHQRALAAPSPSGAATQTSVASSPPESSPSQAISDTSEIDIRELTQQLRLSVQQQEVTNRFNSGQFQLQVRRERIDSLREALIVAKRLKKSQAEITKIDDMLYSLLLSEISENLPCASVDAQTRVVQLQPATLSARFNDQESQPIVSRTVSDQNTARPFQSASHQSRSHTSPPLRRTCTRGSPPVITLQSQRDITAHVANFDELDVEKDGNCGFHVMVQIMQRHFPQPQEPNPDYIELRELICNLMSREANQIFIAKCDTLPPDPPGSFNIYIEDELIAEQGTVAQYCDRMKRDSVCCGLNEFATFVHMVGDDITIMYHSTKVVGGSVEVFPLSRESCRDTAIVYHVLQKDGRDGRDGHFVLLLPRDNEHVEAVD
jgi:hypothetical protein